MPTTKTKTKGKGGGKGRKRVSESPEPDSVLQDFLQDFDIEVKKMGKKMSQKFEREAKKCLSKTVPTKSSFPKVILNMSLREYQRRGNSVEEVLESLKRDRETELDVEESERAGVASTEKGAVTPLRNPDNMVMFTPACSTRSHTTARARRPKEMERIMVYAHSKTTGSPVDEEAVLKLHMNDCIEGMGSRMMDRLLTELPQCHRRKVIKAIKDIKAEMVNTAVDITQTPAIVR